MNVAKLKIGFNKVQQLVNIVPEHKSAGANFITLDTFSVPVRKGEEVPDLDEYKGELLELVQDLLKSAGEDVEKFRITVLDYKTGEKQVLAEGDEDASHGLPEMIDTTILPENKPVKDDSPDLVEHDDDAEDVQKSL